MSDVTVTVAAKAKKAKIATRGYVGPDGKLSKSALPDASALHFVWADKRAPSVFQLKALPTNIVTQLAWHGLSQKLGDGFAGAKGSIDTAEETAEAIYENLVAGTFIERAEGVGPAPTVIREAIIRALKAQGQTVDEKREAAITEKLKNKADRDGALANPEIAAAYAAIRAERAKAKADEAAKNAKTAGKTDLKGLGF